MIPDDSANATDGENANNSTEGEDSGYEVIDYEVIDGGDSGVVVVDNSTEGESQEGENLEASNAILDGVIDRVLQFDRQARTQVQATISQNLYQLLRISQGLTLEVMVANVNGFSLPLIYGDYLWQMGAVYSNAKADDFYSDCWSCVTVINGDFQVTVSWISANSTSS